jgi:hypothetical protein
MVPNKLPLQIFVGAGYQSDLQRRLDIEPPLQIEAE